MSASQLPKIGVVDGTAAGNPSTGSSVSLAGPITSGMVYSIFVGIDALHGLP